MLPVSCSSPSAHFRTFQHWPLHPLEDVQVRQLLQLAHALRVGLDDLLVVEQHPALGLGVDVRDVVAGVDGRPLVRDKRLQTVPGRELGRASDRAAGLLFRGRGRRRVLAGIIGVREEPLDRALSVAALEDKTMSEKGELSCKEIRRTVSRRALRACAGVKPMSASMPTCSADGSGGPPELALESWIGASMSAMIQLLVMESKTILCIIQHITPVRAILLGYEPLCDFMNSGSISAHSTLR